jgi:hypothetical protein
MSDPLNYEGPTTEETKAVVDEFLKNPIKTDGDWPVLTDEDWKELHNVFYHIIEAKFQRDCDNDQVVDYAICNRKKQRMNVITVPYNCETDADMELMSFAAQQASGLVEQALKQIGFTMSERRRAQRRYTEFEDLLGFLASNGYIRAWQRVQGMLNERKSTLSIGRDDSTWEPLGLTCKDIQDCHHDFGGNRDRLDTLLLNAFAKVKDN